MLQALPRVGGEHARIVIDPRHRGRRQLEGARRRSDGKHDRQRGRERERATEVRARDQNFTSGARSALAAVAWNVSRGLSPAKRAPSDDGNCRTSRLYSSTVSL